MANNNNNKNNPKNEVSPLFKGLTKLFSGPISRFKTRSPAQQKRYQLDKYNFKSLHGQSFKKSELDPFKNLYLSKIGSVDRFARYLDFEQMEFVPILNSALDIYADEMTTHSPLAPILTIKCPNQEIKDELNNLFYNVLNIELNLNSWCRSFCKYGDFFLYLDVDDAIGIKNVIGLPVKEVERLEGEDPKNPNLVRFQWKQADTTLENWQIAHFRNLGNDKYTPHGTSVLEPARRVFRQLCLDSLSFVWTETGYKHIKDLISGDKIYSYDYENDKNVLTSVKNVLKTGEKETFLIKTRYRQIEATKEHPFLVKNKEGKIIYKNVENLIVGEDKLILPIKKEGKDFINVEVPLNNFYVRLSKKHTYDPKGVMNKINSIKGLKFSAKNIHAFLQGKKKVNYLDFNKLNDAFSFNQENVEVFYKKSKNKSFYQINKKIKLGKDFFELFGFMLGDGWVKQNYFGFALGVYEKENEKYINLVKQIFGDVNYIISKKEGTKSAQINFYSKEIADLFRRLDFKTGFGKKVIPEWVYSLSLENRKVFVKGLFDADGCDKNGLISLSNKKLIEDLKNLCEQSGIACGKILKDKREGKIWDKSFNKFITKQTSYQLYINWGKEEEKTIEQKIISIVSQGIHEVWDLEVENQLHNFIANGVVVHNCLMEDAMMAYRVIRAPERNAFYIDVKGIRDNDVPGYILELQKQMKQNQIIDSDTGKVDLRYASLGLSEDYFLPIRGKDSGTRIEKFSGGQLTDAIEDIKYLRESLFAAIKIPQSYLIMAEGASEDQSSLSQKDIRFARTIQKLQKSVVSELTKIATVHLFTLGYRSDDLLKFQLSLNNPSKIAELQELEHWRAKFEIASAASEGFFSRRWVAKNLLGLSDELFKQLIEERFYDKKIDALLEQEAESFVDKDLGGLEALAGDAGGEKGGKDEDPVLLASPEDAGTKKEEATTTPLSKGKVYHPVSKDNRDLGARRRSYLSKGGDSAAENSSRNIWKGLASIKTLSNGIAEQKEGEEQLTNYSENVIFRKSQELKNLVKTLEQNKKQRIILREEVKIQEEKKDEDEA